MISTGAKVLKKVKETGLGNQLCDCFEKVKVESRWAKLRFSQHDPILFWSYVYDIGARRISFSNNHCRTKKAEVEAYIENFKTFRKRTYGRCKTISGVFTGAYAEHPFTKNQFRFGLAIMSCIRDGTAVMAVPCGGRKIMLCSKAKRYASYKKYL
jgi:hypothetical protein